jgi:hypothetical protein
MIVSHSIGSYPGLKVRNPHLVLAAEVVQEAAFEEPVEVRPEEAEEEEDSVAGASNLAEPQVADLAVEAVDLAVEVVALLEELQEAQEIIAS